MGKRLSVYFTKKNNQHVNNEMMLKVITLNARKKHNEVSLLTQQLAEIKDSQHQCCGRYGATEIGCKVYTMILGN